MELIALSPLQFHGQSRHWPELMGHSPQSRCFIKVGFDMALFVMASGLYRQLANKMRGYAGAQAGRLFRDLVEAVSAWVVDN